jgi:hypothetical protein
VGVVKKAGLKVRIFSVHIRAVPGRFEVILW